MGQPANPVPIAKVGIHPEIPNLKPTPKEKKPRKRSTNKIRINNKIVTYKPIKITKNKINDLKAIRYMLNYFEQNIRPITTHDISKALNISSDKINDYIKLVIFIQNKSGHIYNRTLSFDSRKYYSFIPPIVKNMEGEL